MLLNVFEPAPGSGVVVRIADAAFAFLRTLGQNAISELVAIVSDNGSDAKSTCEHLRSLVNMNLGGKSVPKCFLLRCSDHSVQMGVKLAPEHIHPHIEKLRGLIKFIRYSKAFDMHRDKKLFFEKKICAFKALSLRSWIANQMGFNS